METLILFVKLRRLVNDWLALHQWLVLVTILLANDVEKNPKPLTGVPRRGRVSWGVTSICSQQLKKLFIFKLLMDLSFVWLYSPVVLSLICDQERDRPGVRSQSLIILGEWLDLWGAVKLLPWRKLSSSSSDYNGKYPYLDPERRFSSRN